MRDPIRISATDKGKSFVRKFFDIAMARWRIDDPEDYAMNREDPQLVYTHVCYIFDMWLLEYMFDLESGDTSFLAHMARPSTNPTELFIVHNLFESEKKYDMLLGMLNDATALVTEAKEQAGYGKKYLGS